MKSNAFDKIKFTMKTNTKIIGLLALVFTIAGCTSTQYGYDDVYDHDYPVAQASTKTNNSSSQKQYYNDNYSYNEYEEEDYTNYNSSNSYYRSNGYYTNRINRFYRPSFSITYFSPGFSYGYGYGNNYYNNNYYYNSSPFFGFNSFFNDPYDWHIHHFHHSQLWGFGYNTYNPWYGYGYPSYYCPPSYYGYNGYNGYNYNPFYGNYDGYQSNPSGHSVYYGPRSNYQKNDTQTQPQIQINYGPNGEIKNETKTYGNGVKVKTTPKPSSTSTPKNNYTAPKSQPRYNTKPTPKSQPRPSYTPQPRPSYSKPKTTVKPSGSSYSAPKTNQSSGVKVKAIKKD